MARATTTWAHASAPRWGETWVRSIKIPRFLATLGGTGILPKAALAVPGGPWVWSLGPFSSIFFSTSINKKKLIPDREARLIKKEYCRMSASPHPPQATPPEIDLHPPREGMPIGAHPWDPGGQPVPGQTSPHCIAGPCLRTGGPARQPHCTLRGPHTIAGGEPGSRADGWPAGSRVRRWELFGPQPTGG